MTTRNDLNDLNGPGDLNDKASTPRESEVLPADTLDPWLREHVPGFAGLRSVQQFRKGHSNLTYLISDGTREWVLRRPPFGSRVLTAHDMAREFRILSRLHEAFDPAPRAEAFCEDPAVMGAPFYLMRRLEGVILRDRPPAGLAWTPELGAAISESFVQTLVRIHAVDTAAIGLDTLGKPAGYTRRQVEGWSKRYIDARTDDLAEMEQVAAWLAERIPASDEGALIHNDFKFDNLVLDPADPTRVTGVLDWEMCTVGHPLMDLGTTLGYWITEDDGPEFSAMPFGVAKFPGTFSRERLVERYAELSGRDVSDIAFYHVFGLFKIAVVAQQIYYRFATGKTTDPRFQMMILGVQLLSRFATRVIENARR